jgi:hypothetical protein
LKNALATVIIKTFDGALRRDAFSALSEARPTAAVSPIKICSNELSKF